MFQQLPPLHPTGQCPGSLSPRPHFPFSRWGPSSAGVGGGSSLWFPGRVGSGAEDGGGRAGGGGLVLVYTFVCSLTETGDLRSHHFCK